MKKEVFFPGVPGKCVVPISTKDDMHEFGLYDRNGVELHTGYFRDLQMAKTKADLEFPGNDYSVRDLTEEWLLKTAIEYRSRIKKLRPSFKITNIILDMSEMYYSRNPLHWYTYIPFFYQGKKWSYRETADGKEWLEKSKTISPPENHNKKDLDSMIDSVKEEVGHPANSPFEDLSERIR